MYVHNDTIDECPARRTGTISDAFQAEMDTFRDEAGTKGGISVIMKRNTTRGGAARNDGRALPSIRGEDYVTYCCKNCGFLFGRLSQVKRCPICESTAVQPATPEEESRFHVIREQLLKGDLYLTEEKI